MSIVSLDRVRYYRTALRLLPEVGPAGITIGRLCGELGVTKGSFYYHFPSVDRFIDDLAAYWERGFNDAIDRHRHEQDPIRRLESVLNSTGSVQVSAEVSLRAWALIHPTVRHAQCRIDALGKTFLAELLEEMTLDMSQRDEALHHAVALVAGLQLTGTSITQEDYFRCWESWMRGSLGLPGSIVVTPSGPRIQVT